MATATCAFCGAQAPTSTMDMTGHGMRCTQCAAKAELDAYRGGRNDMAQHLTRGELEGVVRAGANEAWGGVALGLGGALLSVISLSAGGTIVIVFTGMMTAGFGMIGHGLYRRKQALAAISQMPDARVVR